jgi:hypothetical protein
VGRWGEAIVSRRWWWRRFKMTCYRLANLSFSIGLSMLKLLGFSMGQFLRWMVLLYLLYRGARCLAIVIFVRMKRMHRCRRQIHWRGGHRRWHFWCWLLKIRRFSSNVCFLQRGHLLVSRRLLIYFGSVMHLLILIFFAIMLLLVSFVGHQLFHLVCGLIIWLLLVTS